ncbi:TonB-dependent receptor [Phenylobacterium sp. Root700]|uniref:TonB-dependent receptor n=1 Tax=Phenylobacterium sp. Root700 TaxID=1736591 RepID=UPI0006F2ED53|nr:TonB-dependent receptor [Phenylobacterium sp. Root700]KRB46733.1 TonB-dependent receptor [Phenylobacterium sp. Root700]
MTKTHLLAASGIAALMATPAWADVTKEVSEVVVTAAPYVVSMDSSTTSVEVLKRDDLDTAPAAGLGDVLSGLPGVRSTFFGPGASRPVIRGLAGPRVLVLTNGVGMIDASALSPDHQVATDPQEAERIEVLRGPSALAYGGSAIGGIVNIIDDRIPHQVVDGVHGRMLVSGSSGDDGKMASAAFKAGVGNWVLSLDGLRRTSEDYTVPVAQMSRRLAAEEGLPEPSLSETKVANSAVELTAYGAGVSYVGSQGFGGLSIKKTDTTYGIAAEEDVTIGLKQTRVDGQGELNLDLGPFDKIKFSAGWADYKHTEFEGDEVGTTFLSDGWEGRLELVQPDRGGWQGAVGVQALQRNFDAIGEEALIPKTKITEQGIFTLQRLDKDKWGVEGGLRLDQRKLDSEIAERKFTNISASIGAFLRPAEGWFLGLSGSRTSRAPTEEELFSEGAHPATQQFEVGDADLNEEISYSLDATVHYADGPWSIDLHAFAVKYDGFVDLRATGAVDADSGFRIYHFVQTDAKFYGGEMEASYRLWQDGDRSFTLEGSADYVRGETDLGVPARIPPWSVTGRAVFDAGWWTGKLELRRVAEQDRVAEFELPTDSYMMLNASLSATPFADKNLKLFAEARNINDTEAREHASFLKELAPLPGRSFRVGAGYKF